MPSSAVVIIGAGAIGCSCAMRMAEAGLSVVVVERAAHVAPAASGKAGGFLARYMCDDEPMESMARRGFDLHAAFAAEVGADTIEYRQVAAVSASLQLPAAAPGGEAPAPVAGNEVVPWLSRGCDVSRTAVAARTCGAQVTPKLLCEAMQRRAEAAGARFVFGHDVVAVDHDEGTAMWDVRTVAAAASSLPVAAGDATCFRCDNVVVCTGPWAGAAAAWFPVGALPSFPRPYKAHSIVVRGMSEGSDVNPGGAWDTAVFSSVDALGHPEIYPRPNGDVYCCGIGATADPFPDCADDLPFDDDADRKLLTFLRAAAPATAQAELVSRSCCCLPIPPDGRTPVVGAVPNAPPGAFIAVGHSCWGILNCHATGVAMTELLTEGRVASIDVRAMDPRRFVKASPRPAAADLPAATSDAGTTKRGEPQW